MEKNVVLAALFLYLFSTCHAIWISLPASGTKCVSEEIQNNVVVLADYIALPIDRSNQPTLSVKVHFFSFILFYHPFPFSFMGFSL